MKFKIFRGSARYPWKCVQFARDVAGQTVEITGADGKVDAARGKVGHFVTELDLDVDFRMGAQERWQFRHDAGPGKRHGCCNPDTSGGALAPQFSERRFNLLKAFEQRAPLVKQAFALIGKRERMRRAVQQANIVFSLEAG